MHYELGWREPTRHCRDFGDVCALLGIRQCASGLLTRPANGFHIHTECKEGELCTITMHSRIELRVRDVACHHRARKQDMDHRPECIILYKHELNILYCILDVIIPTPLRGTLLCIQAPPPPPLYRQTI